MITKDVNKCLKRCKHFLNGVRFYCPNNYLLPEVKPCIAFHNYGLMWLGQKDFEETYCNLVTLNDMARALNDFIDNNKVENNQTALRAMSRFMDYHLMWIDNIDEVRRICCNKT